MKNLIAVTLLFFSVISTYAQKNKPNSNSVDIETKRDKLESQYVQLSGGASGVKRSISYRFNKMNGQENPGSGIFRYNIDSIDKVSSIYAGDIDLSGEDQSKWFSTWDDTTGAIGKGRISIVETDGKILDVFDVTGVMNDMNGYWQIPVRYLSGKAPEEGTVYYYVFERVAGKKKTETKETKEDIKIPVPEQKEPDPVVIPEKKEEVVVPVPEQKEADPVVIPEKKEEVVVPVPEQKEADPVVIPEKKEEVVVPVPEQKEADPVVIPEKKEEVVVPVPEQKEADPVVIPEKKEEVVPVIIPENRNNQPETHEVEKEVVRVPSKEPVKERVPNPVTNRTETKENKHPVSQQTSIDKKPDTNITQQRIPDNVAETKPSISTGTKDTPSNQNVIVSQNKVVTEQNSAVNNVEINRQSGYKLPSYEQNNYSYSGYASHRKWYSGIIELGYGIGAGKYGMNNFRFNFINGFKIGQVSSIGLGIGFRHFYEGKNSGWHTDSSKMQIPVFLDLRTNFSTRTVTPYLALGVGNSSRFVKGSSSKAVNEGLFLTCSGGIWFNISDRTALFAGIAYEMQKLKFAADDATVFNDYARSVSLNIGFSF